MLSCQGVLASSHPLTHPSFPGSCVLALLQPLGYLHLPLPAMKTLWIYTRSACLDNETPNAELYDLSKAQMGDGLQKWLNVPRQLFLCLGSRGSRTESVSAALKFLWFIPAAPIVCKNHHSELSLYNNYWCGSVYDCAIQGSRCDSSLLPLWSFTILQLLWAGLDVTLSHWQGSYAVPWCTAQGQIHSSTLTRCGGCKSL